MSKIGILGGTFDPVHNGHLYMAKAAFDGLALDKLLVIPTGTVPHKDNNAVTDCMHRYNMVCIAVSDIENCTVSDLEIKRGRVCYTFETVKELSKLYPDDKLYFIVGADSVYAIDSWKNPAEIFKYAALAVINRNTDTDCDIYEFCKKTEEKYKGEIAVLDACGPDISSTKIRNLIKDGKDASGFMPDAVLKYAIKNKLYTEK